MDKQDKQGNVRLIVAVAISFLVIVIWSKYFAPKSEEQNTTSQNVASQGTQDSNLASANRENSANVTNIENLTMQESSINHNSVPSSAMNIATKDSQNSQNLIHQDSISIMKGVDSNLPSSISQPKEILITIKAKDFDMDIDSSGSITQVYLKADKFTQPHQEGIFTHLGRLFGMISGENKKLDRLPLFADNVPLYPLKMLFVDNAYRQKAEHTKYSADKSYVEVGEQPQKVTLTQDLGDLVVKKILTIYPNMTYDVEIILTKNTSYVISNGMRPNADSQSYVFHGVVLQSINGSIEKIEDGDALQEGQNFHDVLYLASADRYYTSVLFKPESTLDVVTIASFGKGLPRPFINVQAQSEKLRGYIGPKDHLLLESINPNLVSIIEYGRITFFAKYFFILLNWLHSFVGNWGVAIILLTIIIRIILFPLSFKGMVGMQKLKDLAPKMKEIQQKYKGEPQKLQAHMMELYKKHGANPLGGCLPLILQIPVFFAIYRVLYNAVELKNATFILWIHDLSVMDPYFVLPVLMGLSMYLQQSLTPTAFSDPMQAKIFKWLPVIFTIFLITFPAGLILYWTINNIISIIQQMIINKILERRKVRVGSDCKTL